jgi:Ca2+-binding EF-hand superfamily protein
MKEIDENGDGEIDFDEFMTMMKIATQMDDDV